MLVRITVKVVPKSSVDRVSGWMGDVLRISVTAPPERGKANRAVEELLAESLGVPRTAVRVATGRASPRKIVEIDGLAPEEVRSRLAVGSLSS